MDVGLPFTTPTEASRPSLLRQMTWWILALPAILGVALALHSIYWLDFVHIMAATLWTGADLFLGFIIGPVMRRLAAPQRSAVIAYLVPKTLLYMPVVAITTGTAGWYLAAWLGFMVPGNPVRPWILGALIILTLLTLQGLGIILPNNLRIYRELQRPEPDRERITRLNRRTLVVAGIQGVLQVIIIVIMVHLVMG